MANADYEIVVVGGGAAGVAAARQLHTAGVKCLIIEARPGLAVVRGPLPGLQELASISAAVGSILPIETLGRWWRRSKTGQLTRHRRRGGDDHPVGFPEGEQHEFLEAQVQFSARVSERGNERPDVAAASLLERGNRWNNLINAVGTYISGAELDQVSARDFDNYDDTGVNWRVVEGYGTTIAACGENLPVVLSCPVSRIDHHDKRLKIETSQGVIVADQAIVTLPTTVLAENDALFAPSLPEKTAAARGLPLGLADKLFLSLADAEEFETDSRMFGSIERTATAAYHFRPFGRPQIEAYFGGQLARELEAGDERAFFDFSLSELTGLLGNAFAGRVKQIQIHRWGADPFSRGSYSYARPGMANCRMKLAAPIDGRLFFAGEACSQHDFSTAHGGWITGVAAADQAISARAQS